MWKKFNIIKLIFINIVVFLAITEIFSFIFLLIKYKDSGNIPKYHKIRNPEISDKISLLRPIMFGKKGTIVIFGCSYAYGHTLEDDETFSYKLNKLTDYTVVNLALQGEGTAFMYKLLSDEKEISLLKEFNPSIFIYLYITGHKVRHLKYRSFGPNSKLFSERYKLLNGKLVKNQPSKKLYFLHYFYTSIVIEDIIDGLKEDNIEQTNEEFSKLLTESYNIIKKEFPNSKFIIINYPDSIEDMNNHEYEFLTSIVPDVDIINIKKEFPQIGQREYWLPDDATHPSSEAWSQITPIIAKKLKLL